MLSSGEEEPVILYPRLPGYLPGYAATIFFALPMDHGVQVERPRGAGGPKIAVTDRRKRCHGPADSRDLIFGNPPDHHGVPPVAGLLVT